MLLWPGLEEEAYLFLKSSGCRWPYHPECAQSRLKSSEQFSVFILPDLLVDHSLLFETFSLHDFYDSTVSFQVTFVRSFSSYILILYEYFPAFYLCPLSLIPLYVFPMIDFYPRYGSHFSFSMYLVIFCCMSDIMT